MIHIDHFDHFVLTVQDIDRTCDFYSRVLGMAVVTFGDNRKALRFGSQKINLHPADGTGYPPIAAAPSPGSADFCLITSTPMTDVLAQLRACGVEPLLLPSRRTGATTALESIYLHDPDGNLVEISNIIASTP